MSGDLPTDDHSLPLGAKERIDRVCLRFEDAWKEGGRPRIEDYLPELPEPERPYLLEQLVLTDLYYRRQNSERPSPAEYRRRFPEHGSQIEGAFAELAQMADTGAGGGGDTVAADGPRLRILRPHAKGGLGQVSLAVDDRLHREVAFKELHARYADDPICRSRFLFEAEVTGSLEHPGIVPVYAIGRHGDGRPFYVMRFIRGESLTQAIASFHGRNGADRDPARRRIEFRRLLGTVVDVCNTIHYAHSQGIVHRDLKPDNVMLGKFGETLVVDWGLAKSLGASAEPMAAAETLWFRPPGSGATPTRAGSVLGTPAYMSPEQAAGRPESMGPASDVYSLGATLYCLLTGRAPLEGGSISDMTERTRRGDFPRPRAVAPRVPRALEAVCLKAMALKPVDRYPTAAALAEDIEHWLADEPVAAHREHLPQRIGRWMRRHRSWTLAIASTVVLVALVSAVAVVLVDRARRQAVDLAAANASLAEGERAARRETAEALRRSREKVDKWLTGSAELMKYYPGAHRARMWMLEEAARDYEGFASQQGGNPDLEIERGRTWVRLGDVYRLMGKTSQEEEAFNRAISLLDELSARHDGWLDCAVERANARAKLGLLLADTGRHDEADATYAAVIDELAALDESHPDEAPVRLALATCLFNRGYLLMRTGSTVQAEAVLRTAAEHFDGLLLSDAEEKEHLAGRATVRYLLGQILAADGRYQAALDELGRAVESFDALVADNADNPSYLQSCAAARIYQADVLRVLGRRREEMDIYRRAARDFEALTRTVPGVPGFEENLAVARTDLGQLQWELGATAEAEQTLSDALEVLARLTGEFPEIPRYEEERVDCRDMLGWVLGDLGRNEEAERACRTAAETCRRLGRTYPEVPEYRERLAVTLARLGLVRHKLGEPAGAVEALQEAVTLLEALVQSEHATPARRNELARAYAHLGTVLHLDGQSAEADKALRRARELWEGLVAENPAPDYLQNLAWFLVTCVQGELRDAGRAVELSAKLVEPVPDNPVYHNTLGAAHYRAGDWDACIAAIEKAVQLRGEADARGGFFLAMAQWQSGRREDAVEAYRGACQWMQDHRPDNPGLKRIRDEARELLGISEDTTSKAVSGRK